MSTKTTLWAEVEQSDEIPEKLDTSLQDFLDYWLSLQARHGRVPRKSEFDPLDVARLWRGIAVIEVIRQDGQDNRYRYRFLGTSHDLINGASYSGRFIDETLPEVEMAVLRPVYDKVVSSRRPHYWRRRTHDTSVEPAAYERVLAPFLGDGDGVDYLIGFWRWEWRTGIPKGLQHALAASGSDESELQHAERG